MIVCLYFFKNILYPVLPGKMNGVIEEMTGSQ